jgi:hypothetical protein
MRLSVFASILVLCFLLAGVSQASTPITPAWYTTYDLGLGQDDHADATCFDASGNEYVLSFLAGTTESYLFIEKIDPYGNRSLLHSTFLFGPALAQDIAADKNGNVYVTGQVQTSSNGTAAFTYKVFANGGPAWFRSFSSPNGLNARGLKISTDSQSNVYVAMSTQTSSSYDMTLVEYDTNGNSQATSELTYLTPYNVAFGPNGRLFVAGTSNTFNGYEWFVMDTANVYFGKAAVTTTSGSTTTSASFVGTFDPNGNIYVAKSTYAVQGSNTTYTSLVQVFSPPGGTVWNSGTFPVSIFKIEAFDTSHVLISSIPAMGSFAFRLLGLNGVPYFVLSASGVRECILDGAKGLIEVGTTGSGGPNASTHLVKVLTDNSVDWTYDLPAATFSVNAPSQVTAQNGVVSVFGQVESKTTGVDLYGLRLVPGTTLKSVAFPSPTSVPSGPVVGTVTLNASAGTGGLKVSLQSSNPNVLAVPDSIAIPVGSIKGTFNGFAASDLLTPVTVTAFTSNLAVTTTVRVIPYGVGQLSLSSSSVKAGGSVTATVTITGPAGVSGHPLTVSSSAPAYASVPGSVTVSPQSQTITFPVTTLAAGAGQTVTITVSDAYTVKTATLTLTP